MPGEADRSGERLKLVTFLFTDVEGSTTLFEKHPQAYPRAVARHHEILRGAFEAHGGRVFETVGDAAYAVFRRPADAIRAALEAQRTLQGEPWGEVGEIRVRMGLYTGEADERDGRYYGPAVNRCERLASAAHGRQVIASAPTASAIGEGLPGGTTLRDMGSHRLRGLASPEQIFQVIDPALSGKFPPLRTLTTALSKLPVRRGTFVDREREIAEIRRLVGVSRLVTITGPAGIGKTRTALELVPALLEDFPDGAWFVDLERAGSGQEVTSGFWAALGPRAEEGSPGAGELVGYLGPKQLLLVVDRCDRVLGECAVLVDGVLRACRHVKILATSREHLAITGEVAFRIPPLAKPDAREPAGGTDLTTLARYDSVRLFLDRAAEARSECQVSGGDVQILAQLCDELDGVPGAIEEAAAEVVDSSLEQVLAKWRSAGMSDWGYEHLSPAERVLFHRLSVLEGAWTLELAETVGSGGDVPQSEVLDLLSGLVEKSVIVAEASDDGSVHYGMPEVMRRFGQQRLAESGELQDARSRRDAWQREIRT